jgi:hypothetical protein
VTGMCRNIHTLHNFEPAATSDEVHAAALQYVRKIAGTTKPSKVNQAAFDEAVHEVFAEVRGVRGARPLNGRHARAIRRGLRSGGGEEEGGEAQERH